MVAVAKGPWNGMPELGSCFALVLERQIVQGPKSYTCMLPVFNLVEYLLAAYVAMIAQYMLLLTLILAAG